MRTNILSELLSGVSAAAFSIVFELKTLNDVSKVLLNFFFFWLET